jgi:hypothetical protein
VGSEVRKGYGKVMESGCMTQILLLGLLYQVVDQIHSQSWGTRKSSDLKEVLCTLTYNTYT